GRPVQGQRSRAEQAQGAGAGQAQGRGATVKRALRGLGGQVHARLGQGNGWNCGPRSRDGDDTDPLWLAIPQV
ncbi:hypothetical protein BGZ67_009624, partial [Mortierella alpina]